MIKLKTDELLLNFSTRIVYGFKMYFTDQIKKFSHTYGILQKKKQITGDVEGLHQCHLKLTCIAGISIRSSVSFTALLCKFWQRDTREFSVECKKVAIVIR